MRRRTVLLVAPLSVVAVAAGAFAGYGAWSRSQPVGYTRGGEFAAQAVVPTPAVSPSATVSASAAPSPTASATASARPSPRTQVVTGARPSAPTPAAPSASAELPVAPASAAPARRRVPVAGTYAVRVEGSERVRFGPVSFCGRDVPASSSWTVRPATGEGPGSFVVDHRLFPGQEGQHDERHLYRYVGDTVLLEFEGATVTCAGQRQSTETAFSPAQLRIGPSLEVGARWSSRGGDAERTESTQSRVLRTEDVVIAGRRVPTVVVETLVEVTGSERGSRTQRWWWAPSLALPVRLQEEITAGRSGAEYSSSLTTTVVGLPPGA